MKSARKRCGRRRWDHNTTRTDSTAPLALKITKSGHQARKIKRRFQFTITSHYALNDRKGKMVAIPSTALRNAQTHNTIRSKQNQHWESENWELGNLGTWEVRSQKSEEWEVWRNKKGEKKWEQRGDKKISWYKIWREFLTKKNPTKKIPF